MYALWKSVKGDATPAAKKRAFARPVATGSRKGISLVKPASGSAGKSRKSA